VEIGVSIRAAAAPDCAAIAALAGQLGYPATAGDVERRLAALPAGDAVLVAEADGRIVGWVHCALARSLVVEAHVSIQGIVVDESWRGRGIGRRLMAEAEAYARGRGVGFVRLRSGSQREEAHAFYEALGYRRTKTQQVFIREVEPAEQ
jgi:GNAT superfamily N-acetyltransferase